MGRYLIPVRGEMFAIVDPQKEELLLWRKQADLLPTEKRAEGV